MENAGLGRWEKLSGCDLDGGEIRKIAEASLASLGMSSLGKQTVDLLMERHQTLHLRLLVRSEDVRSKRGV